MDGSGEDQMRVKSQKYSKLDIGGRETYNIVISNYNNRQPTIQIIFDTQLMLLTFYLVSKRIFTLFPS